MSERGFTLIEVLIATFIMAILSTMGVVLMDGALRSKNAADGVVAAAQELELARSVIKSDLAQVTSRRARDAFGGDPRRAFSDSGGDDELIMSFVRNGRETVAELGAEGASSLQYVEYRFLDGALIRRSRTRIDPTPETPHRDRILLSDLEAFRVEYFDGASWRGSWVSAGQGQLGLDAPPAVAVYIRSSRFGELRSVFLTPAAG